MTIRRSTASPLSFLEPSGRRPSHRSWISRDAILLLYQQANNHQLRKLASGREMYLIPTGDIASVVFMMELLNQFRNRGIDLDRVAMARSRQDRKMMDKTSNTKYIAQVIAQHMQAWIPLSSPC